MQWDADSETLTYRDEVFQLGDTLTVMLGGDAGRQAAPKHCPAGRYGSVAPAGASLED